MKGLDAARIIKITLLKLFMQENGTSDFDEMIGVLDKYLKQTANINYLDYFDQLVNVYKISVTNVNDVLSPRIGIKRKANLTDRKIKRLKKE